MSAVERIEEIKSLPLEGLLQTSHRPPSCWPAYGIITFEGVSVVDDNGDKLLKRMFCCIRAQEKVSTETKLYFAFYIWVIVIAASMFSFVITH